MKLVDIELEIKKAGAEERCFINNINGGDTFSLNKELGYWTITYVDTRGSEILEKFIYEEEACKAYLKYIYS
jgi:hypothetical protein